MPTKKPAVAKKAAKKTAKKAVKKAVKKSPVKKAAAKKTTKKNNQKTLVYASNQKSFWVSDGQILNSLVALRDALDDMEKEVYKHHVTTEKNDFATWVESVLDDVACATSLKKAKTPKSAKTAVVKHLKLYSL